MTSRNWLVIGAGLVLIASFGGAWRSRGRSARTRRIERTDEFEWNLPDDLTQAAANALPDESGAFNAPPSTQ
jgi:hypothetical protein